MQEPITINGTVVERSEALATVKEAVKVIKRKLSNAQASTLAAARQLASIKESEAYFALLTDKELEASDANKTAWSKFYRKCGLSASKASRLATMATVVDTLVAKGVKPTVAEAVTQDTARAINQAVKAHGWKKVVKKLSKVDAITTPVVDGLFKASTDDKEAATTVEASTVNTPTDTPTVDGFNETVEALETIIKSDKPLDYANIDFDHLEALVADLQAVLANRPTN